MHAYQFHISPNTIRDGHFNLTGEEFRHCCRVLRKNVGDLIDIFDGNGNRWSARIESISKENAACQVLEEYPPQIPLKPGVILGVGILKSSQIEEIVVNAAALNVAMIAFLHTVHSIKNKINSARLEKLVLSAAKQSGQSYLPEIRALSLESWFRTIGESQTKLLAEQHSPVSLSQIKMSPESNVAVMIGPEGGFDESEIQQARQAGFVPVNIFPYRLRTELAAVMAVAGIRTLAEKYDEANHGN